MAGGTKTYLECCLYFTANSLSRVITKMADEEFNSLGMCTSHAFLLMVAIEEPGIGQKELALRLNLAQSTISRFVDSLVRREYLEKNIEGKHVVVSPTLNGKKQLKVIKEAWANLYRRYCLILGEKQAKILTEGTFKAYQKLEVKLV